MRDLTGIILLGIFGSSTILGSNGPIYGNITFFGKEMVTAMIGAIYPFVLT